MQTCLCVDTKPLCNAARRTSALVFTLLMTRAGSSIASPANIVAGNVTQARIAPKVVQIDVVDGKDLRFSRLTRAEGVSQTRVSKIVQDDRGFIWFATQYGLNRYDGYSF